MCLSAVDYECCKSSNRERNCGYLPCLGDFFSFLKIDSGCEHGFERGLTVKDTDKGLWFGVSQSLEVGITKAQRDTVTYIR